MLVLTIRPGEPVHIGNATLTILEQRGQQARVGIEAPREVEILRDKLRDGLPAPE